VLPNLLPALRGPTFKGEGKKGGEGERREKVWKGREG